MFGRFENRPRSTNSARFAETNRVEGGIRLGVSAQLANHGHFLAQARIWQALTCLLLIAIVYGRLVLFGIVFSTLSAQSDPCLASVVLRGRTRSNQARRRSGSITATSDIAASYSRYSSDLQDESSIDQQQRKCREKAEQLGQTIPSELEFFDEAVSGTKKERNGLSAMMKAAREGRFESVYFDSLSRLARESVISLPMLKEFVYVLRIRVIAVADGIDSNLENWELLANFMSWNHEYYLKGLRASVLRGQEEAVLNDWSAGDWCFGYGSEPIPGTERVRKGRRPKPRMRVLVNEEHAAWVRRIFCWFVEEKREIAWIVRELNRLKAPKDHRATTPDWRHDLVRKVLGNEKYIGIWPWGRKTNVRNPLTGQIIQEARPPEEAAKWVRERPQLRLIEDLQFFKAKALLDEFENKYGPVRGEAGRLRGSVPGQATPRHMLQGLFKCRCGATLQVCGVDGKYLGCPNFKRGLCRSKTYLLREIAEQRLSEAIAQRILAQPVWLDAIAQETQRDWDMSQKDSPSELIEIEKKLQEVARRIQRLLDEIERDPEDKIKRDPEDLQEVRDRLRERRKERMQLERRRMELQATAAAPAQPPTREWIKSKLTMLREVLKTGGADANAAICGLVGGQIIVEEGSTPGRKRKHLIGRFTLSTVSALTAIGLEKAGDDLAAERIEELTVTFAKDPPWEAVANRVKELVDEGVPFGKIGAMIPCHRSWVAKGLALWYRRRGLEPPDGRAMRNGRRKSAD